MSKTRGIVFGLMGATLLSGCGEIAYKTGAGADALQADQHECKLTAGGPTAYKSCMNAKGWAIADLDAGPSQTYAPAPKPAAGMPAMAATSPPGAPPSTMAPGAAPAPIDAAPPAADPTTPVQITAWVKFGGGGPQADIDACVAKLGPGNAPDKVHKTVTVALLACMRDAGWRGL